MKRKKGGISRCRSDKIFDVCNVVILSVLLLIVLYPFYFMIIAAISDPKYILGGETILLPKGITFEGIQYLLQQERVWTGYGNTIVYTVVGTFCNLLFTLPAGYVLSRKDFPARHTIMFLFTFTVMFNGGLMPTYLTVRDLKLLDTMWAIILPNVIYVWNLIVARSFFLNIPGELQEAAFVDGCSNFRLFGSIILPVSKAMIAVVGLYYAVGHWNTYFDAMIYLSSPEKFTLQLFLREILIENQAAAMMGDSAVDFDYVFRMANLIKYSLVIVSTLPLMLVYPFIQKYFVKGVMVGAVKG